MTHNVMTYNIRPPKTKKAQIELYDKLYSLAEFAFKMWNPCKIINWKCTASRFTCCCGCNYRKRNGCTVKNLTCKLYRCEHIADKHPELAYLLQALRNIADHSGFWPTCFTTKQYAINKSNSREGKRCYNSNTKWRERNQGKPGSEIGF